MGAMMVVIDLEVYKLPLQVNPYGANIRTIRMLLL